MFVSRNSVTFIFALHIYQSIFNQFTADRPLDCFQYFMFTGDIMNSLDHMLF